ncbi:hypothetical protein E4U53_000504 [Claviceps sorghi]|nr:hypothetical protein E4U53_000504 [Claviceps sorghi]
MANQQATSVRDIRLETASHSAVQHSSSLQAIPSMGQCRRSVTVAEDSLSAGCRINEALAEWHIRKLSVDGAECTGSTLVRLKKLASAASMSVEHQVIRVDRVNAVNIDLNVRLILSISFDLYTDIGCGSSMHLVSEAEQFYLS